MPPLLVEVLLEHRSRTSNGAGELVFFTRTGKPHDPPEVLKRAIHPALARLGLPRVGWRAFRHTVATLLQHLGESVKVAQAQLGHSNPYTTLVSLHTRSAGGTTGSGGPVGSGVVPKCSQLGKSVAQLVGISR